MQQNAFTNEPKTVQTRSGNEVRIALSGDWTSDIGKDAENFETLLSQVDNLGQKVVYDFSQLRKLDTVGAWLIVSSSRTLQAKGFEVLFDGLAVPHKILLNEIGLYRVEDPPVIRQSKFVDFLADIGKAMLSTKQDILNGMSFFGEVIAALSRIAVRPKTFRFASMIAQMEQVAWRGVPIIVLISFLVGCIIAQQGIFQLKTFGATVFVVDLIGILTLRELAVLLTAIMIAGRSGSAYTAELGSMKMNEEVDALRVMGLDPIEVLIVPRILALVIGLPLLTFIASMSGLLGGAITTSLYGGIPPDVFLSRLQSAIAINTFFAGLIKAPFMAMVIGIIACSEGLSVKGSAESLGRNVTSAVVKSIFMVIVMDGVFAVFYAAIDF